MKGIALLLTWCFSLPGSSSVLWQLNLLLKHRVWPWSWGIKAEGSVRKQGEASRKPRLQLSAAQPRFAVPAGGKAETWGWDGRFCKRLSRVWPAGRKTPQWTRLLWWHLQCLNPYLRHPDALECLATGYVETSKCHIWKGNLSMLTPLPAQTAQLLFFTI